MHKMSKWIKFELFKKGEAIFHYGNRGKKYYYIVLGGVNVYLPKTN